MRLDRFPGLGALMSTDTSNTVDPAWYDVVGQFQQQYAVFNSVYSNLLAQDVSQMPQALQDEYNNLMSNGATLKSTVDGTMSDINSALTYLKSVLGIGFINLLPVAVIAAALAAITYWLNSAYRTTQKLSAFNAALQAGGTVDQATAAANNLSGASGFMSAIGGSIGTVIVVVALLLIVPKLMKD